MKLIFFFLICFVLTTINCLERTKIINNGLYKLQNQNDGRFLTAGANGTPTRREWRAGSDQKFTFTLTKVKDEDAWTLTPIDKINALVPQYKITYVGHGKSQFKSLTSGLCLQAHGTGPVGEGNCERDDPRQRWFVDNTTEEEKS